MATELQEYKNKLERAGEYGQTLISQNNALQSKIQSMESQLDLMTRDVEEGQLEIKNLEGRLTQEQNRLREITAERITGECALEKMVAENDAKAAELDKSVSELSSMEAAIAEKDARLASFESGSSPRTHLTNATHLRDSSPFEEELKRKSEDLEAAHGNIDALKATTADLTQALQSWKSHTKLLQEQKTESDNALRQAQTQLQEHTMKCAELENTIAVMECEISEEATNYDELQDLYDQEQELVVKLRQKVADKKELLRQAEMDSKTLIIQMAKTEDDNIKRLRLEMDDMEEEIAKLREESTDLKVPPFPSPHPCVLSRAEGPLPQKEPLSFHSDTDVKLI
jgi:chromosome segregation ATPase